MTIPPVVIDPIWLVADSVNQSLPSGPAFPESDQRIDDAFLRELAAVAKECGISGKELATILNEDAHILLLEKKH